jgi:hypothetical protein
MKSFQLQLLALLCLLHSPLAIGSEDLLVNVLSSQIGQTEHPKGSNWGRPVQEYLEAAGINRPAPWCAAFIEWGLQKIGRKGAGAYVPSWNQPSHRIDRPSIGSLGLVWFPQMKRYGHIFCVKRVTSSRSIETIEGNSNAEGSREGYAVVSRVRPVSGQFVKW